MEIVDVQRGLLGAQAEFVGAADGLAAFDAAARHPHREAGGVVVATVALLGHRGAAEFAAPDDEGVFKEAAGLQVLEQAGDGLIHRGAEAGVVALDLRVGVPLRAGAVVDLDEAHAAFDHAAGEEAESAHALGRLVVEAVEFARGFGLAGEVDDAGRFGLHACGHLVTRQAGAEFGAVRVAGGEVLVHAVDQAELAGLQVCRDRFGRVEIRDRLGTALDAHALVARGHEAGAPVARPVDDRVLIVLHHDERGQVVVLGTDAVVDPRAQRRLAREDRACVHLADAGGMVDAVRLAGTDDREVIGAGGDVRDPVGEPLAGLAVLLPLALRSEEGRLGFAHRGDDRAETVGQALAGQFVQQRLWVEEVHLRRTAFHEKEDDALGAGLDLTDAGLQRRAGGGDDDLLGEQVAEGHGAEAEAGVEEEVATRRRGFEAMAAWVVHST